MIPWGWKRLGQKKNETSAEKTFQAVKQALDLCVNYRSAKNVILQKKLPSTGGNVHRMVKVNEINITIFVV